ncbi:MAG: U32 family peptidase, partial [Myxococcota bacterium]|nr:U32 family peptidase [Myxococcota bacterium]
SFRPIEDDGRPEPAVARHRAWLDALGTRGFTASGGLPLGPCGLCALPQLAGDGVDGVKVVGREAHPYRKVRSVQMVRHVLDALRDGGPERARRRARALREDPDGCRGGLHCYYPEARSADE